MMDKNILQGDYSSNRQYKQVKLPIDLDCRIPEDDPVRLLDAFVDGMDLSELYASYGRVPIEPEFPRKMFKIVLLALMNKLYSSREMEEACKKRIDFMYLLNGKPAPDHATFARFLSLHFVQCSRKMMAETTQLLKALGEISGETVFIDGTKIEANANKYTFVWKKKINSSMVKLFGKISDFVEECENTYGIKIVYTGEISLHTLKRMRKKLFKIKEEEGIEFVHGAGKKQSPLQKSVSRLDEYIQRLKDYIHKLHICGERKSYSKTDPDATFMRMKEDAMKNGQLKPAYNVQNAVDSEYIVWTGVNSHPADVLTLKEFLQEMEKNLLFKYIEIVADAGYESEENYIFLEENEQLAFIKPTNYEISKTGKYKKDISRKESMTYNAEDDSYSCVNGRKLIVTGTRKTKSASGYISETTIYTCPDCSGCEHKDKCIKGHNCKTPMEERNKVLYVSKKKEEKRAECLERLLSEKGIQLRMNRSIQVEGSFATLKEDMGFRRFTCRGKENVLAQSILMAIAYNINKLHHKIQAKRTGTHLFEVKKAA